MLNVVFNPRDWYWVVGSDDSRAWSSAAGCYVVEFPTTRITRIDSEDRLSDVLKSYGLPGPVPPHREELHNARRAARTAAETGGFIFNGHPFDSDRDSILRIANAATTALTANLVGAPFATEWHCADGYDMPLDAAGVMSMQGALAAHGQACHDRSSALRAMIDAPDADMDALADEIKIGWPG